MHIVDTVAGRITFLLLLMGVIAGFMPTACSSESVAPEGAPAVLRENTISAGWRYSCGVHMDGSVDCWGANEFGQAWPPGGEFRSVSAGESHACGVRTDGRVDCWGYNRRSLGKLDRRAESFDRLAPAGNIPVEFARMAAWTAGGLTSSGRLGRRAEGFDRLVLVEPIPVGFGRTAAWNAGAITEMGQSRAPGGEYIMVSAGTFHTCGVRAGW